MEKIFVGRQPILTRDQKLYGYELLFRDGMDNAAHFIDGDDASSQVIFNTFMDIGLENIVGSHPAFINLPRHYFTGEQPMPMSSEQVVLELLEDIEPSPEVIAGMDLLISKGFTIALDDFRFTPEHIPMIERARYIKVDVLDHSVAELTEQVATLRPFNVTLLAEKVETIEQFELCQSLGFGLFQGFYFSRPHIIKNRPLPSNRLLLLQLLAKLQNPDSEFKEIEQLILQDAALSYRLLRYINSATFALRREVASIHQAIILLGINSIRNWSSLLMMSRINNEKPLELMVTSLVRARMCELVGESKGLGDKTQFFTVGLLSILDALLDRPMEELLDQLPLTAPLKLALLYSEGKLGGVLQNVRLYERGEWDAMPLQPGEAELYRNAYLAAIQWADEHHASMLQLA